MIFLKGFKTFFSSFADILPTVSYYHIRIFNGCEVPIENSVTRVTVRHHEACRVMLKSYPRDGIFNLHRRIIIDSFSCISSFDNCI